ncbi:MAG: hypothetical protein J3K34DRAFT_167641 [Monoraphidium minutum]|nr:MAG: hypothetical protein J3K34DRAFT_167641 [Monoraphidium minutum]
MAAVRPHARERKPVQQGGGQPRGGVPAICGRAREGPCFCNGGGPPFSARAQAGSTRCRAAAGRCACDQRAGPGGARFCNGGGPPTRARAQTALTRPMRSTVIKWRTISGVCRARQAHYRAAAARLPAASRGHGDESHTGPALPHGPRPARAAPLPGHAVMNRRPQEASTVASRVESATGQCPTLSPPHGAAVQQHGQRAPVDDNDIRVSR